MFATRLANAALTSVTDRLGFGYRLRLDRMRLVWLSGRESAQSDLGGTMRYVLNEFPGCRLRSARA